MVKVIEANFRYLKAINGLKLLVKTSVSVFIHVFMTINEFSYKSKVCQQPLDPFSWHSDKEFVREPKKC